MKQSYYKSYSWMVDDLELSGNDLNAFALIYSFNENDLPFNCSLSYIQKRLGIARNTALKSLKYLCEKSFLLKEISGINGNKTVNYIINVSHEKINPSINNSINRPVQNMTPTGSKKKTDRFKISIVPVQKTTPTGSETEPNNNNKENNNKYTPPIKENGDDGTSKIYGENYQYDFSKIKWSAWNHNSGIFIKSLLEVCGRDRKISHFESQVKELMENNIRVTDPEKYFQPMLIKHLKSFDKW